MRYLSNQILIDSDHFLIQKNGGSVPVEPKVFDLIVYLIERRHKMVSREELLTNLWPDLNISDASLGNAIKGARKCLEDDGKNQHIIKTIHSRGYQFVAEVEEIDDQTSPLVSSVLQNHAEGPLIAVLPLQNMSFNKENDYLAEGISEDLTTELTRFKNLKVLARHTAFQLEKISGDFVSNCKKYQIDYVIEGSLRVINDSFKINIQLIDTQDLSHVWAESYEGQFEQIYQVQDHIIEQVVAVAASEIVRVETGRSLKRSSASLSAYDYFLRGLYYHKTANDDELNHLKSMDQFKKAIELDSQFVRARVWYCCARFATWDELTKERLELQINDVKAALQINPHESECHRLLGMLYHYQRKEELSEYHHAQALSLSPNDAYIVIKSALFLSLLGKFNKALELAQRAQLLNPLHPGWYWRDLAVIYYGAGQYRKALDAIAKNPQRQIQDLAFMAACYVALKKNDRAKQVVNELLTLQANANILSCTSAIIYRDQSMNQQLAQRMRQAGLK